MDQEIREDPAQNQQGPQRHVTAQADADAKRDGQEGRPTERPSNHLTEYPLHPLPHVSPVPRLVLHLFSTDGQVSVGLPPNDGSQSACLLYTSDAADE